jgi:hypothetical protein
MTLNTTIRTSLAAVLLSCVATATLAAPIQFTWNPNVITGVSGQTQVTASSITVSDFSNIAFAAPSGPTTFSDQGYLSVQSFLNGGGTVSTPGLNAPAPGYSLYFAFSGTGSVNHASVDNTTTGTFTTLNYGLYGVAGTTTFTPTLGSSSTAAPTVNGAATVGTLLAHGTLIPGTGSVGATCDAFNVCSPTAQARVTFIEDFASFFVAPPQASILDLFSTFTSTSNEVTPTATGFNISQGGGSVTAEAAPVPEPGTLALVGSVLLGWVGIRRRKTRKAGR